MSKNQKHAVAGFFDDFDLSSLATQIDNIKAKPKQDPKSLPSESLPQNRADDMPHQEAGGHTHKEAYNDPHKGALGNTHDEAEGHTLNEAGGIPHERAEGMTLKRADVMPHNRAHQPVKSKISSGVTDAQKNVLKWLVKVCGEEEKLISYSGISQNLSISLKASRTHLRALERKGFISATTAYRHNSRQALGTLVRINASAHLALALTSQSEGMPYIGAEGMPLYRARGVTYSGAEDVPHIGAEGQTICSSSINTTTTELTNNSTYMSSEQSTIFNKFDELILDDWKIWGLQGKSILHFLDKDISILQDILDKTAYVIKQKSQTEYAIQSKIGFLRKCLENEFCEVDNNFVSRKEKLISKKIEQMKLEADRIRKAREEEKLAAIDLVKLKLTRNELKEIRDKSIARIREDIKNPELNPSDTMIASYENRLLLEKAESMGFISDHDN